MPFGLASLPALPFDAPLEPIRPREVPYRRATLAKLAGAPWQGSTSQSAHASLEGARTAMAKDGYAIDQARKYYRWLLAQGELGGTDYEASQALNIQRSSINARRHQLGIKIGPSGFRPGPTGIKNTVWRVIQIR